MTTEPLANDKSTPATVLDLAKPVYSSLPGYAGRIGKLLNATSVRTNPNLAGSLDDLLGVIYVLIQARQSDLQNRASGTIEIGAVEDHAHGRSRAVREALRHPVEPKALYDGL